jgi:hypothetical protein
MAHVFWHNRQKVMILTPGYGNCGKLGKKHHAEFPTVPTAPTAGYRYEEKDQNNGFSKAQAKWIGQDAAESVKTTSPGHSPLAGFEVTTYGRFSSDHRGLSN